VIIIASINVEFLGGVLFMLDQSENSPGLNSLSCTDAA
jgi:hypothetical protein